MGGSSKKVTVGYKYYLGMHLILTHGPADKLLGITVDGRRAWSGASTGGRINVKADNLFGGEKREGGVSGAVDLEMGLPAQGRNDYLQSQLGSNMPAYRGVVGVVLRQCYLGLNPYLKKWAFRLSRIHKRTSGLDQWYDEKAAILSGSMTIPPGKSDWRYLVVPNSDAGDYSSPAFDDSSWAVGAAPFADQYWSFPEQYGFSGTPGTVVPEAMKVWMRTSIHLSEVPDTFTFEAFIDNDATLYVNGVAAVTRGGHNGAYYQVSLPGSLFQQGNNYICAVGSDRHSGTGNYFYFDWRLRSETLDVHDMNPAHIIRECLTDPEWGMGYQETDIDDSSFTSAADKLYAEGFGISILWDRQTPIEDFVKEIVRHINAVLYVDRSMGKFSLKLIRGDYSEGSLLTLGPDQIDKVDNFSRPAFGELINSVTVNYWNGLTGKTASTTAQDTALVQMQGAVIGTTIQYPGCTSAALAGRLASRDLQTLSNPLLSCTIYADRTASLLNIGDVFKLDWPDLLAAPVVMRVVGLAFGDGKTNKVKVTCTEDIFSLPQVGVVTPQPPVWEDPSTLPIPADDRVVIEAPYYELVQRVGQTNADQLLSQSQDSGLLIAAAGRPAGAISAVMVVNDGSGYENSAGVPLDFCPTASVAETLDASYDDVTVTLIDVEDADVIEVGQVIVLGAELVLLKSFDSTTGAAVLGRGILDTLPKEHAAGATLFFSDFYFASDEVEYVSGEVLGVKILPVAGLGQLDLASAPADSLTMGARAFRPYPPAGLLVDGVQPHLAGPVTGFATLTYLHRDRLQQTAASYVEQADANVGPEPGTTYELEVRRQSDNTLVDSVVGVAGTTLTYLPSEAGDMRFQLASRRDGYRSWQAWAWEASVNPTFTITGSAPVGMREGVSAAWTYGTSGPAVLPVTFSVLSGDFPSGLVLDSGTGEVTGTPLEGQYEWVIAATDDSGAQAARTDSAAVSESVPDSPALRRSMRVKVTNYWEFNGSNVDAGRAGQNLTSGSLAYVSAGNGRQCLAASTAGARTSGSTNCVGMNLYHSKNRFSFGARVRTSQTDLATLFAVGTGGATTPSTHLVYVTLVAGVLRAFVRAANNDLFILVDSQARDLTSFRQVTVDGDGSFFRLRVDAEEVASVAAGDAVLKRAGANGGMFVVGAANPIGLDVQDMFWAHDTLTVDELKYLNNAGLGRVYPHFSSEPLVEADYDAFVVGMSPVTFYKLNETSGSSVANSAPGSAIGAGSLSGASLGSVAAPPGFSGENSIKFNGGNTGITLPAIDLSSFGASFALSAFIWLDGSTNYGRYFHLGQGTTNTYAITLNQSSTNYGIFSQVFNSSGNVISMATGGAGTVAKAGIFATGVWKQVSLQYDGSTLILSCWVDGLCADAGQLSSPPPSANRTGSYLFRSGNTTEGSNGRISRAVMASATGQNPIPPADLVKMHILGMGL